MANLAGSTLLLLDLAARETTRRGMPRATRRIAALCTFSYLWARSRNPAYYRDQKNPSHGLKSEFLVAVGRIRRRPTDQELCGRATMRTTSLLIDGKISRRGTPPLAVGGSRVTRRLCRSSTNSQGTWTI